MTSPPSLPPATDRRTSILLAGLSIALLPVMAFTLGKLGLSAEVAAGTSAGIVTLISLLLIDRTERTKSRADRVAEAETGESKNNPIVIMLLLVSTLIFFHHFFAGFCGGVAGAAAISTAYYLDIAAPDTLIPAVVSIMWAKGFIVPFFLLLWFAAGIPLGVYAGHRLRKPMRWMLGAITLWAVTDTLLSLLALSIVIPGAQKHLDLELVAALTLILALALLPALWLGVKYAHRTQYTFVTARLVKTVGKEDRAAILDLLRESQSESSEGTMTS